jgi:rod shape determining protein RodA
MEPNNFLHRLLQQRNGQQRTIWQRLHIDSLLLLGLVVLMIYGLLILTSALGNDSSALYQQITRIVMGLVIMFICAQIPPEKYRIWIPWVYSTGIFLLIAVLIFGHTGKGAQRWLNLGIIRFQPSELMKIAVPMIIAWYLGEKELPPRPQTLIISFCLIAAPALMITVQPDLGTGLMIMVAGFSVIFLACISWRLLMGTGLLAAIALPVLWFLMHDYQRNRVLTFLNPDRDPLGAGYHIIQSKIAIGSGGLFGKGWFNGTQAHLDFLPEHSTDFIFSVLGEEWGFFGCLVLLVLYLFIVLRSLRIADHAYDTFTRLLAGSLAVMFFFSVFVNIGMVSGILPVVGMPLPLVSYGGTSVVTILACFGILMSISTHRQFVRGQ